LKQAALAAKRFLALVAGAILYHSRAHRWLLRRRAVIVLFHRVDDRYARDPITRGWQDFRRFLRFFRRFFHVVTLAELLRRLEQGEPIDRCLVITFDDGYRDNHAAGTALADAGLPACFFITTDFIESNRVPWWDAEAGIPSEWMTWDQVRALRDAGFEIGAHTCNHVDLGKVHGSESDAEIRGSKGRLEGELGARVTFFSFPYGRRDNFTEDNRLRVRASGFAACLSAHGGTVTPETHRYALPRIPISQWLASPYHFGLEVIRGRSTAASRPSEPEPPRYTST